MNKLKLTKSIKKMRRIKDFIETKKRVSITHFNNYSKQDLDDDGGDVFVYMEHYYISIVESKEIGYKSIPTYYLTLENRCYKETNLNKLEKIMYKWYLDNVENDDWLYNVGIFNPLTTPLYYKVFKDMGFEVEDITYHNDCSDSFTLSLCNKPLFDIYLPTSGNYNPNQEDYNAFHILKLDDKSERIEEDFYNQLSLQEVEDYIEESLHQIARDIIDECNILLDKDKKVSLCDYMTLYGDDIKAKCEGKFDYKNLYKRLKRTLYYFDEFTRLEKWYIEGSEPQEMFEDYVEEPLKEIPYMGIQYLYVQDKALQKAFRYKVTPKMRIGYKLNDAFYEEIMFKHNHCIEDCNWMVSNYKRVEENELITNDY